MGWPHFHILYSYVFIFCETTAVVHQQVGSTTAWQKISHMTLLLCSYLPTILISFKKLPTFRQTMITDFWYILIINTYLGEWTWIHYKVTAAAVSELRPPFERYYTFGRGVSLHKASITLKYAIKCIPKKIAFLVNESSKNSIGSLSGHTQLWVLSSLNRSIYSVDILFLFCLI